MSSPVSNVGALPPIPQIDYYFVSAGEINDFPAGDMNNLGLLGNDREMAGGMAGGGESDSDWHRFKSGYDLEQPIADLRLRPVDSSAKRGDYLHSQWPREQAVA